MSGVFILFNNITIGGIIQVFMLIAAISIDTFFAFFSCGAQKMRVSPPSAFVVSAICTGVLLFAALLGAVFGNFVPDSIADAVCFATLFLIGLFRIFDSLLKARIRKSADGRKKVRFRAFGLHFFLEIYANPEAADLDACGTLSPKESALLAVALSFDGAAAGFGAGTSDFPFLIAAAISFLLGLAAVWLGLCLGRFASRKLSFDPAPLSGIMLIALAIIKG